MKITLGRIVAFHHPDGRDRAAIVTSVVTGPPRQDGETGAHLPPVTVVSLEVFGAPSDRYHEVTPEPSELPGGWSWPNAVPVAIGGAVEAFSRGSFATADSDDEEDLDHETDSPDE